MRELSLQTWCCTKEMERPDNIFFKEQQSQTRKRARKAPNDGSGCVVCFAFITTNLRCSQRHYYFFLETKMATRNDEASLLKLGYGREERDGGLFTSKMFTSHRHPFLPFRNRSKSTNPSLRSEAICSATQNHKQGKGTDFVR